MIDTFQLKFHIESTIAERKVSTLDHKLQNLDKTATIAENRFSYIAKALDQAAIAAGRTASATMSLRRGLHISNQIQERAVAIMKRVNSEQVIGNALREQALVRQDAQGRSLMRLEAITLRAANAQRGFNAAASQGIFGMIGLRDAAKSAVNRFFTFTLILGGFHLAMRSVMGTNLEFGKNMAAIEAVTQATAGGIRQVREEVRRLGATNTVNSP